MDHSVQIPHSKDDNPTRWISVTVSRLREPNVTMDVKEKQRTIIEFRPLEGRSSDTPMERVWFNGALSHFTIEMDQRVR
jgi:hypothetical protein